MRTLLIVCSLCSLVVIGAGTVAFMHGVLPEAMNKQIMLWGSLLWFACTPFWMQRNSS